jgi:membrane protein
VSSVLRIHIKSVVFVWRVVKSTTRKFLKDNGSFLAAALAFNLLLYSVPFLLLLISALGFILGSSERALPWVLEKTQELLPQSHPIFADVLPRIVIFRNLLGLVAIPLFLFLSSRLFGAVRLALSVIFAVRGEEPYLQRKARDLITIFVAGFLMLVSVGISSLFTLLQAIGDEIPGGRTLLRPGWILASHTAIFLVMATLLYTLYRFSPAQTISRKAGVISGLSGAALFYLSKWAFVWYVSIAKMNALIYGAVAGLIFFHLWLYYACLVFVLGAELGWTLDHAEPRDD